jgi:hypothetical protein
MRPCSRISALVSAASASGWLRRRLQPRTIVAEIVGVDAVDDVGGRPSLRFDRGDLVEVRLAEVAAVDGVFPIAGDLELVDLEDHVLGAKLRGQGDGLRGILLRIRRRDGRERDRFATEHVMRDAQEKARIHAPRETDEHAAHLAEGPLEVCELVLRAHIPSA